MEPLPIWDTKVSFWGFRRKFSKGVRDQIPREGVIIEFPLNDLFHDIVTVILTSQMGVSEMVINVGNIVTIIYGIIQSR